MHPTISIQSGLMACRQIATAAVMALLVVGCVAGEMASPVPAPTPTLESTWTPAPTRTPKPQPTATPLPASGLTPSTPTATLPPTWTPEPSWTPEPTWTPAPTWTPKPQPTVTLSLSSGQVSSTPTATAPPTWTPVPQPTATPSSPSGSKSATPRPTPQRHWPHPTLAIPPGMSTVITGTSGKWVMGGARSSSSAIAYSRNVSDRAGQQYTCIYYHDGTVIPRINLAFPSPLRFHEKAQAVGGATQGAVRTVTTVAGDTLPVDWRTWVSRTDRLRLRGDMAQTLIGEVIRRQASGFKLHLPDNPELSRTYSTAGLAKALETNVMHCFQ